MAAPLVPYTGSKKDEVMDDDPHIYFLIDTTGSMGNYIRSLKEVLEQIFRMVRILFGGKVHLHIIAFKDYCDNEIIAECHDNDAIQQWVETKLKAGGGGDHPEAAKTALNVLYRYIQKNDKLKGRKSFVMVYTDAPPHHMFTGSSNMDKESNAIEERLKNGKKLLPGFDWISICRSFTKKGIPIFTFMDRGISPSTRSFWQMLGAVVLLPSTSSDHITKATIGTINQLMGANDENFTEKYASHYKLSKYANCMRPDFDALINENDCNGLLPSSYLPEDFKLKMNDCDFMTLKSVPFLSSVLVDLPKKLKRDEGFRNLVFSEFEHIMTERNVCTLSYNAVFGSIWRGLCCFRSDDRLKVLQNTFSLLIQTMDEKKKEEMQQWIDESYDETEEINEMIRVHLRTVDAEHDEEKEGAPLASEVETEWLTLDAIDVIPAESLPTKKELLTISHSLFGDIIGKVQRIMTHLMSIKVAFKDRESTVFDSKVICSFTAIPISMSDEKLFSLLSHLVIPGTLFSQRPSLIMAIIAYLSRNITLKDRAQRLLLSARGRWIDLQKLDVFPEFLSVPFVKLVVRCHRAMNNQLLSESEAAFYDRLHTIYRVRSARPKLFELVISFEPKLDETRPDFKRKCVECGHWRSFTIMTEGDRCGKCIAATMSDGLGNDDWKLQKINVFTKHIDFDGDVIIIPDKADLGDVSKRSHLTSCRSCSQSTQ